MKIIFVTNFMNHHQLTLCDELNKRCDNFVFLATEPVNDERLALGYEDMNHSRDYIIRDYDGSSASEAINKLIVNSDVVMFGNCKNAYVNMRFKNSPDKLTFFVIERLLKRGLWSRFIPIIFFKWYKRIVIHKNQNVKILCASAFTPYDLSLLGFAVAGRCIKWGYFPQIEKTNIFDLENKKSHNKVPEIIFCGRLIKVKKFDDVIRALAVLKNEGFQFHLTVIGDGPKRNIYEDLAQKLQLEKCITFIGSVPFKDVKSYMVKANIAVFSSGFREGWGAVLNEYMANSCAIVASSAPGSVPYILRNNENSKIYRYGDDNELRSALRDLITNSKCAQALGQQAYKDYYDNWTPKIAAERLVGILTQKKKYIDGPCSEAKTIKNDWFK